MTGAGGSAAGPGEPSDRPQDDAPDRDLEEVVRHRIRGHEAALRIADQLDRPDALSSHINETEHRLAEDQDILHEIAADDPIES